jgi:hypothetical protein
MPVRICGLVELHAVDRAHAAVGVEENGEEGSHHDEDDLHLVADADEENEHRQVRRPGNGTQHLDQRLEEIVERAEVPHGEPERDAGDDREQVAEHLAPERCEQVAHQCPIRDVGVPGLEDLGDRRPGRRLHHVERRELPQYEEQHHEEKARKARLEEERLHAAALLARVTCSVMPR